jgi:hypothetical protein
MGCIRANFKYSCRGSETIPMVFGSILNIRVEVVRRYLWYSALY